jgi:hypothetical protein
MKKGDILYYDKSNIKIKWFEKDQFSEFTDGKQYKIKEISMGSIDGSLKPIISLYIIDDRNQWRFMNYGPFNNLARILKTIKQIRKEKIKRLKTI